MDGLLETPGGVRDLDSRRRAEWSALVSSWFDRMVERMAGEAGAENARFFNPLRVEAPLVERRISWDAFPRPVKVLFPGDPDGARRAADEFRSLGDYHGVTFYAVREGKAQEIVLPYRPQDEYCELSNGIRRAGCAGSCSPRRATNTGVSWPATGPSC
ncbi:hypothetical protein ACQP2X_28060 [Actinoplanes sp. CA-131856]